MPKKRSKTGRETAAARRSGWNVEVSPMPSGVSEYLAYFGLAPQEIERSHPPKVIARPAPHPPLSAYLSNTIEEPWGPTVPVPEAAIRAGRRLYKVLDLPRDQPLLEMIMHTVP